MHGTAAGGPARPVPLAQDPRDPAGGTAAGGLPAPREGQERAAGRDPLLDNAKFLLIVLVVVGHTIEPVRGTHGTLAAYGFIYLFHMPLFVIVTGYLSRSFGRAKDRSVKLVSALVVPYVIFQVAYVNYDRYVGGAHNHFNLFDPYGLMWFILALVVWRASTSFWQRVRWPLAIAAVLALAAGCFPLPGEFDMHRTIGFLPFYVLGLCLKPSHLEVLRERGVRIGAAALLAAVALGSWLWVRDVRVDWLWWAKEYTALGVSRPEGIAIRLALLVGCAVVSFAVLAVVPRRRTWFTRLGANTLYVYLLHGFVVFAAKYQGVYAQEWTRSVAGAAVLACAAVVLTVVLSLPPVVRVFRPLLEPKVGWAFRK